MRHSAKWGLCNCYAECHLCRMRSVENKPFMLSVIVLNVVMLNVFILNVVVPFKLEPIEGITLGWNALLGTNTLVWVHL
jgi:hypothetical protein